MPGIITHSNSSMSRQALRQQAEKHRLVRLFRGAYMDAQEYAALDISGRYRARAQAFLATHAKLRAWGITAAALEGAPVLGGAPLHFGGARSHAKSKQDGCAFHEASLETPSNPVAQTLFECASTSPCRMRFWLRIICCVVLPRKRRAVLWHAGILTRVRPKRSYGSLQPLGAGKRASALRSIPACSTWKNLNSLLTTALRA